MKFFDRLTRRGAKGTLDPAAQADAEAEAQDAPAITQIEGPKEAADRELPSVNATKKGSKATGFVAMAFIGALGVTMIYQMNTGTDRKERAAAKKEKAEAQANAITGTLPAITVPDKPPAPLIDGQPLDGQAPGPMAAAMPSPQAGQPVPAPDGAKPIDIQSTRQNQQGGAGSGPNGKKEKTPFELMQERRRMGTVAVKYDGAGNGSAPDGQDDGAGGRRNPQGQNPQAGNVPGSLFSGGAGAAGGSGAGGDELSKSLQPTITKGTVAAKLFDRNYLIPKGAFIDCALETRIDSTVPGMTSCILSKNIYSDNGKLVLLDRGSKIVGQHQGGIKQGQARIFVLWTRVETPTGVVINLDSPGTDALGASGLDGYVDRHFWERFGGAIMLSLIQDGFAVLTQQQQAAGSSTTNVSLGNTQNAAQNMATEALKNSINIPPTLTKNHGEHINIYVARDLDFRSVYGIRAN
jgi:type IV secretion system protein VirB10